MIPTDEDIKAIRESIEATAGMDEELRTRCGQFIRNGQFDAAVRDAFVVLEERLRSTTGKEGMTGVPLANHAFAPDGPLSMQLGRSPAEQEGLRELYSGAFKLYRNPAAHGMVNYSIAEGKSIIGLVNLLLTILSRVGELTPFDLFPANVQGTLSDTEKLLGNGVASRLRTFVGKCIKMGVNPQASTHQWIPFRRHALVQYSHWPDPRPHLLTVFYLVRGKEIGLKFPVNDYYTNVKGLDLSPIHQSLKSLGFARTGKSQDYYIALHASSNQAFFDGLLEFVNTLNVELEKTLQNE